MVRHGPGILKDGIFDEPLIVQRSTVKYPTLKFLFCRPASSSCNVLCPIRARTSNCRPIRSNTQTSYDLKTLHVSLRLLPDACFPALHADFMFSFDLWLAHAIVWISSDWPDVNIGWFRFHDIPAPITKPPLKRNTWASQAIFFTSISKFSKP